MIDNFELIKSLFYFNEGNNMFFHLQILRRGKDHPELPAANKLIQSWLVRSRDHLDKIRDEITFLCEHYQARAYINVAAKDFDKLNALIMKKLADNAYTGNIINPWHVYNSACGELPSRRKCWVVDIDTRDLDTKYEVLEELDGIWLETHPEHKEYLDQCRRERVYQIAEIPTLNGCHLITHPFNLQKFKEKFPNIDVHKNNPTVLYVPQSICETNKKLIISQIDGDGVETAITYKEAVEFLGTTVVEEAVESAKAGCARVIDIDDDSDITGIGFLYT